MREGCEEEFAEELVVSGARDVAFDLGARVFDELVVLHAGRTRRHAGHAAQTVVHVQAKAFVERRFALRGFLHHVDAAARRVHLFSPEDVGGTRREAEAAVDAVVDEFGRGRVMRIEVRGLGSFQLCQMCHVRFRPESGRG